MPLPKDKSSAIKIAFRHNQISDVSLFREEVNGCRKFGAGSELRLSDRCLQLREHDVLGLRPTKSLGRIARVRQNAFVSVNRESTIQLKGFD